MTKFKMMKSVKIGAMLGALLFALPTSAALIPLGFDSGFVEADILADSQVYSTDVSGTIGGITVNRELAWLPGINPPSTLIVTNFNPTIDTNSLNTPVVLQTFNQVNNVLSVPGGTVVGWTLGFVSELTINGVTSPLVSNMITFNETLNQDNCSLPTPNGTNCDDIYTVNNVDDYIDIGNGLSLHVYLQPGSGVQCLDSATVGMLDCYTAEANPGSSDISVVAEVVSNIPEPNVLLLLGVGLLGMRMVRKAT